MPYKTQHPIHRYNSLHDDLVSLTRIKLYFKNHNYFGMTTLLTTIKMPILMITTFLLAIDFSKWPYFELPSWFGFSNTPAPILFKYLLYAMLGDLFTGLAKSWKNKKVTRSVGFKRSGIKLGIYASIILAVTILCNMFEYMDKSNRYDSMEILNWAIVFLVFTECYSIFENIEETYPKHPITRFFVTPVMRFMRGKMDKLEDILNNESDKPTEDNKN
jgi:phage-related holin